MISLSFDELRLITQIRNISDYENKSKDDLIKALGEPKPETLKPKPETPKPKPEKPKPKNPKTRNKTKTRRTKNKSKN